MCMYVNMHVHLASKITVVPYSMFHVCSNKQQSAVCWLWWEQGEGGQRNVAYMLFLSILAAAYITTAMHQRLTTRFSFFVVVFFSLWIVASMDFFAAFPLAPLSADFACLSIGHLKITISRLWSQVNGSPLNIAGPSIVPGICLQMSNHWQTFAICLTLSAHFKLVLISRSQVWVLNKKVIRLGQTKHIINFLLHWAVWKKTSTNFIYLFIFILEKLRLDSRSYIEAAHVYFYVHVSSTQLALRHLLISVECGSVLVYFIASDFMWLGLYEQLNKSVFIISSPWHTSSLHCKTRYKML